MNLIIRRLADGEEAPYALLLLADPSRAMVDKYLKEGLCCVAAAGTETVGVFVLARTKPDTVEIMNIAVREDLHGRGIGKRLIRHAVGEAKALGASCVEIGTGNSSIGQLALYQKCGFRIVGIDRDFFTRHYDEPIIENGIRCRDMIRLRLELTEAGADRE